MLEEVRYQAKCYHASPEYCRSFWGKYIWIYQGKGSLTLTTEGLSFHSASLNFDIPLEAIRGFSLGEFSRASKPFGLFSLILRYEIGGKEFTTHLVPHLSWLAPTWETNKVVLSWFDTLRSQKTLADRVDSPLVSFPPTKSRFGISTLLLPLMILLPLAFLFLGLLINFRR